MAPRHRALTWSFLFAAMTNIAGCGSDSGDPLASDTAQPTNAQGAAARPTKLDTTGPEIRSLVASVQRVTAPTTLVLTATVVDVASGVLKVEFYQKGRTLPVAIAVAPPYRVGVPLGALDAGPQSFFVKAYDSALGATGAVEPNITTNSSSPTVVSVDIPANRLAFKGGLAETFGDAPPTNAFVTDLVGDPSGVSRLFLATTRGGFAGPGAIDPPIRELYEIDYAAGTFRKGSMPATLAFGTSNVAIDPRDTRRLVTTVIPSDSLDFSRVLYQSPDSGATWTAMGNGFASSAIKYLKFSDSGSRLFAYSDRDGSQSGGFGPSFYASEDDGTTWRSMFNGLSSYSGVGPISLYGPDASTIYVRHLSTLYRSTDAGENFQACATAGGIQSISHSVDPSNPSVLLAVTGYIGPSNSKLIRSDTACDTTVDVALPALPGGESSLGFGTATLGAVHHVRDAPGLVYVMSSFGSDGGTVLRSKDGGITWTARSYFDPQARGSVVRAVPAFASISKPDNRGDVDIFLVRSDGTSPTVWRFVDNVNAQ